METDINIKTDSFTLWRAVVRNQASFDTHCNYFVSMAINKGHTGVWLENIPVGVL